MNTIRAVLVAFCVLTASAVTAPAAENAVAEVRAAIEAGNSRFSELFARGDFAGIAALYTAEAILLPPGEDSVRGSSAIGQFWKKSREGGVLSAKLTTTDVDHHGDIAVEVGTVELAIRTQGKPDSVARAKYLVSWRRQADGGWKMHRDIWNDLPAAK